MLLPDLTSAVTKFINSHPIDTLQWLVKRDELKCLAFTQLEMAMASLSGERENVCQYEYKSSIGKWHFADMSYSWVFGNPKCFKVMYLVYYCVLCKRPHRIPYLPFSIFCSIPA